MARCAVLCPWEPWGKDTWMTHSGWKMNSGQNDTPWLWDWIKMDRISIKNVLVKRYSNYYIHISNNGQYVIFDCNHDPSLESLYLVCLWWDSTSNDMEQPTICAIRYHLVGCEKVPCFQFKKVLRILSSWFVLPKNISVFPDPRTIVRIIEVLVLCFSCSLSLFLSINFRQNIPKPTALSTMRVLVAPEANGTQRGDSLQMDKVQRWWPFETWDVRGLHLVMTWRKTRKIVTI